MGRPIAEQNSKKSLAACFVNLFSLLFLLLMLLLLILEC